MASCSLLTAAQAQRIDEELMDLGEGGGGWLLPQLMELAGLACAEALVAEYPAARFPRVLILAGPGNNGGDGLVAARHLRHAGYAPTVCYAKPGSLPLFACLVQQLRDLDVPFVSAEEVLLQDSAFDVVVDALFGFSFAGKPRPPFDALLRHFAPPFPLPVVSVDIPSGWHVEEGDLDGTGLRPAMLISLTAPKLCARHFQGEHHYLGGRFVPPRLAARHALVLPPFPAGAGQCVRL